MNLDFQITVEDVKAAIDKGETFTLVDVREPWEHELARIGGSKLIPMGDIPARVHQELDPDERIIAYCHRGVRSLNVVNWLRQQGFEKAQSMSGGIDRWSRVIDPKVPTY
jgi:rhodanese-related sulfurtransferase